MQLTALLCLQLCQAVNIGGSSTHLSKCVGWQKYVDQSELDLPPFSLCGGSLRPKQLSLPPPLNEEQDFDQ